MHIAFIMAGIIALILLLLAMEKIPSLIAYMRNRIQARRERRAYLTPQTRYYVG